MKEYVLYGLPKDETRPHMEEILMVTKSEQNIETAQRAAKTYGWHNLRVAIFDPRKP